MQPQARLTFSVPTPPTEEDTIDNPDETLAWLNERLRELITVFKQIDDVDASPALDPRTYMVLYATAHDYSRTSGFEPVNGANEKLFNDLADTVRSHCKSLRAELLQSHAQAAHADRDVAILKSYAREWKRHGNLAKLVARIYSYMERYFLKGAERDKNGQALHKREPDVLSIQELLFVIWRKEVVIGSSEEAQDPESILEVAVRLRGKGSSTSNEGPSLQASADLLCEVFDSFDAVGVRIGTWHATEEDRMLRPKILVKHETLRSGLKITSRVPLAPGNGLWTGFVQ